MGGFVLLQPVGVEPDVPGTAAGGEGPRVDVPSDAHALEQREIGHLEIVGGLGARRHEPRPRLGSALVHGWRKEEVDRRVVAYSHNRALLILPAIDATGTSAPSLPFFLSGAERSFLFVGARCALLRHEAEF